MLCCWVEDPNSEAFKLHLPRIFDFLWLAEDGMKMQVQKQYHPYSRSTNHNNKKKKKKEKKKKKNEKHSKWFYVSIYKFYVYIEISIIFYSWYS